MPSLKEQVEQEILTRIFNAIKFEDVIDECDDNASINTLTDKVFVKLHFEHVNPKKEVNDRDRRPPSGFNRPTSISEELADFLDVGMTRKMARTEATKMLHRYIRDHDLQKPSDGRIIIPDDKLKRLLKVPDNIELSYFNLQTYLSPHFLRS